MAVFRITTKVPAFKDGTLNEPLTTSSRESRAKKHARKLRADGFRSVMLFKQAVNGWLPVSFKQADPQPFRQYQGTTPNINSVHIDLHPENGAERIQTVAVKLNRLARKAANA